MKAIEIEKKVKAKARRAPRPMKKKDELPISEQTDTTLVPPSKGNKINQLPNQPPRRKLSNPV
jgi:hypothetical protein